jgi:hypothetical protein
MGIISLNEGIEKQLNTKKTIKKNFPSFNIKNIETDSTTLTLGNINDSPSNKVKNMKILSMNQNYNFINVNNSDDENYEEEEKLIKGKKDKKGNLLIMNSLNYKNNINIINNEEKILKKSNKFNKIINEDLVITKDKIESDRDKIIDLLKNIDLKPKAKFKFADFEGFVKRFL